MRSDFLDSGSELFRISSKSGINSDRSKTEVN